MAQTNLKYLISKLNECRVTIELLSVEMAKPSLGRCNKNHLYQRAKLWQRKARDYANKINQLGKGNLVIITAKITTPSKNGISIPEVKNFHYTNISKEDATLLLGLSYANAEVINAVSILTPFASENNPNKQTDEKS